MLLKKYQIIQCLNRIDRSADYLVRLVREGTNNIAHVSQ